MHFVDCPLHFPSPLKEKRKVTWTLFLESTITNLYQYSRRAILNEAGPSLTTNDRHAITHHYALSCPDCQRNCQNCQGPRTEHRVLRLKCNTRRSHQSAGVS